MRHPGTQDKREVWVRLTPAGRAILRKLALAHRTELERSGPELAQALNSVLRHSTEGSSGIMSERPQRTIPRNWAILRPRRA